MEKKRWDDRSLEPATVGKSNLGQYAARFRRWQGIPGICWAGEDRLLATWYSGGNTEGSENYVLVVKSDDAGKTWTEPIAVVDPSGNVRAYDPTIWRDPAGQVWLFWAQCWSPRDEKIWDGRAGVWCSICKDPMADDLVWSQPRRICDGVMLNKPWIARDGRWLLPVSIWNLEPFHPSVEGRRLAGLVVSDDNGERFEWVGGTEILDNIYDEHVIFDRDYDTMVLWSRTKDGMAESLSHDGGITWCAAYKNGLTCPNSRFNIARTRSDKLLLVNHHEPRMEDFSDYRAIDAWYGRNNLTVLLSDDEGTTWTSKCLLDERQGVSYPDVDVAPDGRIAVIYDFDRFNVASINVSIFKEDDIFEARQIEHIVISRLDIIKNNKEALHES